MPGDGTDKPPRRACGRSGWPAVATAILASFVSTAADSRVSPYTYAPAALVGMKTMPNEDSLGMHVSPSGRVLVVESALMPGDEDLIANRVGAGASVVLAPGVYVFETGWRTDLPYELIGAGKEATVLRFRNPASQGGAAIEWHGPGAFRLSELTLEYEESEVPGGLIRVESGNGELRGIAVRGATSDGAAYSPAGGMGVQFTGSSSGHIVGSTLESNEITGLAVEHDAIVLAEASTMRVNGTGTSVSEDAWLTVRDSRISENARNGVEASGSAKAVIIGSTVTGNGLAGVAGNDSTWVTVVGSSVSFNGNGFVSLGAGPRLNSRSSATPCQATDITV